MSAPESIVTSLDWSRKLEKAGWPQDAGLFYWQCPHRRTTRSGRVIRHPDNLVTVEALPRKTDGAPDIDNVALSFAYFAAPTAEEILRRLPGLRETEKGEIVQLHARPYTPPRGTLVPRWELIWMANSGRMWLRPSIVEDTLANAAAAMYCYLAEQKLLPAA